MKSLANLFIIILLHLGVDRGDGFNLGLGEKSNEVSIQKHREADKFRYYAPNPQSQSNPVLELDEFYSKDEKVPKIDLESYAKDHNKEKEGIKFEQDMAQLTKELENLDEGKYYYCHCPFTLLQPCKSAQSLTQMKTWIFLSR